MQTVFLQADGIDLDEASRVHGREALERVHGSVLLRVEVAGVALAAQDVSVALVDGQPDLTGDVLLAEDDRVLDAVVVYPKSAFS